MGRGGRNCGGEGVGDGGGGGGSEGGSEGGGDGGREGGTAACPFTAECSRCLRR